MASLWPPRRSVLWALLFLTTSTTALFLYFSWLGFNSDRYYFHPFLAKLIPAGTCACQSSTTFQCDSCLACSELNAFNPSSSSPKWTFQYGRDDRNEGLDRDRCQAAFPGLFEDVVRATNYWKARHGISMDDLDAIPLKEGMGRAFIYNGELYVVATRAKGEDHRRKILAVLSSIHRALVASPHRASQRNIEFVFSIEDRVDDVTDPDCPVWVLARTPSEQAVWLMPDFGFWAWDNLFNSIGPYNQVVDRIERSELPWNEKKKQLVWRGKPSFAPKLRRALIDAARDKPWDDVRQVDWYQKTNVISMEDHCNYMFIAHVEGRSYSASLKYRQACRSVIVAHKLQFIQHHHYLLVSSGPHQNFVEVERNFTDLAEKMDALISNPEMAERIANNSVKTFRERYLTQAAEACYWRTLFEGYGTVFANQNVSLYTENDHKERGLRYESFVLLESRLMFDYNTDVSSRWY
ncbi:hypothetical protein VTN77DRAFT_7628 [Rasamsonia byssochlamydoides]|uniref:uncharacterized protein n=1 Tax=Rasamsonia byssochlamydoides TaxID=89139 RepID=UPI0037430113